MPRWPQLKAFINSGKADSFPTLTIRYLRGADPVLKLLDEDGEVEEEMAIEKWNTDSVEEFLGAILERVD